MKKNKLAIVTLTVANYGNRLQNLAAQMLFEDLGYKVETIHNPFEPQFNQTVHNLKNIIKLIFNKKKYAAGELREKSFSQFDRKYIHFSNLWINKQSDRKRANKRYDYFACGSDQLWNPTTYNYGANNFAMFADSYKKITIAPSFGVTEFPEKRRKEFQDYLKSFKHLSVREKTGAEIIYNLTGQEAEVVLDPTLMFDADIWSEFEKKPEWLNEEKFILNYTLGKSYPSDWIKNLADKYGFGIINLMDTSNIDYFTTSPAGFLYLIHHSQLMVTDSFHGSVFSVLFRRPLVIVERKDEFVSMNTRLDNLIDLFQLQDRRYDVVSSSENPLDCNYNHVDAALKNTRRSSYTFLKNALSDAN